MHASANSSDPEDAATELLGQHSDTHSGRHRRDAMLCARETGNGFVQQHSPTEMIETLIVSVCATNVAPNVCHWVGAFNLCSLNRPSSGSAGRRDETGETTKTSDVWQHQNSRTEQSSNLSKSITALTLAEMIPAIEGASQSTDEASAFENCTVLQLQRRWISRQPGKPNNIIR